MVRLLGLSLFEEILDLLLQDGILLGGLLRLASGLLGLEASLELDLHVAGHLTVRHVDDGVEAVHEEARRKRVRISG